MSIFNGIIISILGGIGVILIIWLVKRLVIKQESNRVYEWLKNNTTPKLADGDQFRSTRAISSHNNLTEDRVRYICSIDKRIFLSTGNKEDMWGIYRREPGSIYEERGIITMGDEEQ